VGRKDKQMRDAIVVFTIEELTKLNEKQLNKLAEYLKIDYEDKTREEVIQEVYYELNKPYMEVEQETNESVRVRRIREMMEGA
jgi:hypothetical protein